MIIHDRFTELNYVIISKFVSAYSRKEIDYDSRNRKETAYNSKLFA